jgi:ribosome biogenesis protein ENP2
MIPLVLQEESDGEVLVNTIDINPAHQLLALGIEGNGTAQYSGIQDLVHV